jgi:hypothetical protein
MRLKVNSSTAVVVKSSWADSSAIRFLLRRNQEAVQPADGGHILFARVLDDSDSRGLWIELNAKEHADHPAVECYALMIPWHDILALVVADDFTSTMREGQKLGISQTII